MQSNVPRGEVVAAVPLVTGALGGLPLAAPYMQWIVDGRCLEHAKTSVVDAVLVAGVFTVPFLFVLWPARWLRRGRTLGPAFLPLILAFVVHVGLLLPAVLNPLSNFLSGHGDTSALRDAFASVLLPVVSLAGVYPVWTAFSVRADTTAPRFEAMLASCGLWLVLTATLARFLRSAQALPLGEAAPVVLVIGVGVTVYALLRRRARTSSAAKLVESPYRRDAKEEAASELPARRRLHGFVVVAIEVVLVVTWSPGLADRVARPCPSVSEAGSGAGASRAPWRAAWRAARDEEESAS